MSKLFSPLKIREVEIKNRIAVSPMCQYSAVEGFPTQWHKVHYGTRAVGGAGLIIQEATAVCPEGRISSGDLGLWNDEQTYVYKKITNFIHQLPFGTKAVLRQIIKTEKVVSLFLVFSICSLHTNLR